MYQKEERIIAIPGGSTSGETETKVNSFLKEGWRVKSVTAQHTSTGAGSHLYGGYLIVIEKNYEHEEEN